MVSIHIATIAVWKKNMPSSRLGASGHAKDSMCPAVVAVIIILVYATRITEPIYIYLYIYIMRTIVNVSGIA